MQTERLAADRTGIARAALLLKRGENVAIPTETVYGLAGLAASDTAVSGIFHAKGRPADNPLIVHVSDFASVERLAVVGSEINALVERFMPGPLTIVLQHREGVVDAARAGLSTVALRIPANDLALALISAVGPLVAPSANSSGRPSPTDPSHVLADLDGKIAGVLMAGTCQIGIESTVLDMSREVPRILRPGAIEGDQIAAVLGRQPEAYRDSDRAIAPGMRHRHYAPTVPISVIEVTGTELLGDAIETCIARIDDVDWLLIPRGAKRYSWSEVSVHQYDASNFYQLLRAAEQADAKRLTIVVDVATATAGLLDRIRRAAGAASR